MRVLPYPNGLDEMEDVRGEITEIGRRPVGRGHGNWTRGGWRVGHGFWMACLAGREAGKGFFELVRGSTVM